MNDSMSIILATTILALGGIGLYMYKSSDDIITENDDEYNESNIFGSSSLFNWGDDKEETSNKLEELENEDDYKPRRKNAKTLKSRKTNGSSKRRY